MFLGLFGVPSALTSLGVHVTRLAINAALGEHDIIYPATLQDLRNAWTQRTSKHIISFNELPHGELVSFLTQADAPLIVFLNSATAVANELINGRKLDPLDAIRTASISMSILQDLTRYQNALVIRSDGTKVNELKDLARRIINFVGLESSETDLSRLLAKIAPNRTNDVYFEDLHDHALSKAQSTNISAEFLSMYNPVLEGKPITRLEWRSEYFLLMDKPGTRLKDFIDFIGPARTLTYGPYFGVPRGSWVAVVDFTVKNNVSGNRLLVDVTSDVFLARGQCKLPASGDFQFEIKFDAVEPRHGVEIRLGIMEGAIEGSIRLNRVALTRLAS